MANLDEKKLLKFLNEVCVYVCVYVYVFVYVRVHVCL